MFMVDRHTWKRKRMFSVYNERLEILVLGIVKPRYSGLLKSEPLKSGHLRIQDTYCGHNAAFAC